MGCSVHLHLEDHGPALTYRKDFKIKHCYFKNGYTVLHANWSECSDWGGNRILVFEGDYVSWLEGDHPTVLHFTKNYADAHPLVAQFSPCKLGKIALDKFLN